MTRIAAVLAAVAAAGIAVVTFGLQSSEARKSIVIPPNSVGSKQVIDHSLTASDLAPGLLRRGPRGERGSGGPAGPAGAAGASGSGGPAGPAGAAGASGPVGAKGDQGAQGPVGPQGPKGNDGVIAYAFVVPPEVSLSTDPVLIGAQSKNFDSVTSPALGLYCLHPTTPLDPTKRSWVASAEYTRSSSLQVSTAEPDTGPGCPAGTFAVRTLKFAPSPSAHWAPAWDVAFMVVVP